MGSITKDHANPLLVDFDLKRVLCVHWKDNPITNVIKVEVLPNDGSLTVDSIALDYKTKVQLNVVGGTPTIAYRIRVFISTLVHPHVECVFTVHVK